MTTKVDEEIVLHFSPKRFGAAERCELIVSVRRNVLVLVFHYIVLTCALASGFEVRRFIILWKIQLFLDEVASKSLNWLIVFLVFFAELVKLKSFEFFFVSLLVV